MLMQQELFSEPEVIVKALAVNLDECMQIAKEVKARGIKNITVIGRGSSDNAGLCFKYFTEILTGIPVGTAHPSVVTMYNAKVNYCDHMVVAISQSGRSIDTVAVMDNARRQKALTVAVTNDPASPLAQTAHHCLDLSAGNGTAVAATKTFASALAVLYQLAACIAGKKEYLDQLKEIPDALNVIIDAVPAIRRMAVAVADQKEFIVLSRGIMQGIGKELALKFNQCCYSFSQFYSITDFMHGPFALLEEGVNVVLLAPENECAENYYDIATRANLLGANLYIFSDSDRVLTYAKEGMKMPGTNIVSSAFVYGMTVHLFAMYVAVEKGLDPDFPRNMKRVTITK